MCLVFIVSFLVGAFIMVGVILLIEKLVANKKEPEWVHLEYANYLWESKMKNSQCFTLTSYVAEQQPTDKD